MMKRNVFRKLSLLVMVGVLSVLAGCSPKGIQMPENSYFLCATNGIYNAGVKLFNSDGEICLDVENACVECCVDAEGKISYQAAGVIEPDTVLFVDIDHSPDEEYLPYTGIWDVDEERWIIEPENGAALISTKDDVLFSFQLGDKEYGPDYMPKKMSSQGAMEMYPKDMFVFENGLVLKNKQERDGKYFICDQYENEYLKLGTFLQVNKDSGLEFPGAQEIAIEDSVLGKYMVISIHVWEPRPNGTTVGEPRKYLCDINGKILFPEFKYEYLFYPENQYEESSHRYLELFIGEDIPSQFFDLEKEELVDFPEGYLDINYATQEYFLLNDGFSRQIFDAGKQELGLKIELENPGNVCVFGPKSYVVQDFVENKVVIEGKEYDTNGLFPSAGEMSYPVIRVGKILGPYEICYILNSDGELILKTKENVRYADEFQYLVLTDKMEYVIRHY